MRRVAPAPGIFQSVTVEVTQTGGEGGGGLNGANGGAGAPSVLTNDVSGSAPKAISPQPGGRWWRGGQRGWHPRDQRVGVVVTLRQPIRRIVAFAECYRGRRRRGSNTLSGNGSAGAPELRLRAVPTAEM